MRLPTYPSKLGEIEANKEINLKQTSKLMGHFHRS
jgi:hypothetical protein